MVSEQLVVSVSNTTCAAAPSGARLHADVTATSISCCSPCRCIMGHQKLPRRPSNTRMKHHCSQSPTRVGRTLPCTCHCCWTAMPLQQQADAFVRAETSHTTHARMVELVLLLQSLTLPHSIKQTPTQLVPKKPPRTHRRTHNIRVCHWAPNENQVHSSSCRATAARCTLHCALPTQPLSPAAAALPCSHSCQPTGSRTAAALPHGQLSNTPSRHHSCAAA